MRNPTLGHRATALRSLLLFASNLGLAAGCAGGTRDADPFGESAGGTPTSGVPTADTAQATEPSGISNTSGENDDTGGAEEGSADDVIYDVENEDPDSVGPGGGCEKIDFLFVIDNSGSMNAHQQNLISNFGPFMDTITQTVDADDYHVMAVDTDACPTMNGSCTPSGCEEIMGAGQVRGCAVAGNRRYMTSDLPPSDLKSSFECVAAVGAEGSAEEMPMNALVEGITTQDGPGQCNEGFIRDDAVLVVTIITDDHPGWFGNDNVNGFGGTPQGWFDDVVARKGKPENVVVLGLLALLEDQSCINLGPNESGTIIEFVDKFDDRGLIGSVCSPDYNAFFEQATALIDTACDEFEPEG